MDEDHEPIRWPTEAQLDKGKVVMLALLTVIAVVGVIRWTNVPTLVWLAFILLVDLLAVRRMRAPGRLQAPPAVGDDQTPQPGPRG